MTSSLYANWQQTASREPSALALIEAATGRKCSRAEVDTAAEKWAADYGAASLAGLRVLFAEPNGLTWLSVFIGLLRVGAVPVPADSSEPAVRLAEQAQAVRAAALWQAGQLHPLSGSIRHRRAGLCLLKLTSGSTGDPQAHPFTHDQMLADGRQVCSSMGISGDDINLAVIPFGHSYGLGSLVVPLLDRGVPVVCASSPLPQSLAADIERWCPTVFPAVPALLRALVASDISARMLSSLRLIVSAGAALPAELATAFVTKFGRRIHGFYGTSETGGIAFDRTGDATLAGAGVGTPLEGVKIEFMAGRRFRVSSPAVGGNGRYRPADLGISDGNGGLVLVGRIGKMVKIGGRRLDPSEVEHVLLKIPGVRGACVLQHPKSPDTLVAAVASDLDGRSIRANASEVMAAWKLPARFIVLPDLPTTPRGKTDRYAVARMF
jgi:acyl-CoA synthetase (AMP-forming)/AMP-acid ligase II